MKKILLAATILAIATGCANHPAGHQQHTSHEKRQAVAKLMTNTKGLTGRVEFTEENGQMTVTTYVDGLSKGAHGFHIHEIGDCSKADFTSAGGHFNPDKVDHGSLHSDKSHAGDLGNLVAGDDLKAYSSITAHGITLGQGATNIVGRAVIIHEKADDFVTQPTGNAGGRLACGIIELQK